jgi:hypothetical protein
MSFKNPDIPNYDESKFNKARFDKLLLDVNSFKMVSRNLDIVSQTSCGANFASDIFDAYARHVNEIYGEPNEKFANIKASYIEYCANFSADSPKSPTTIVIEEIIADFKQKNLESILGAY